MKLSLAVLSALIAHPALAAGRARYGGTLTVAALRAVDSDPSLAMTPAEAPISELLAPPVCRLDAGGRLRPVLATELTHSAPLRAHLGFSPQGTDALSTANETAASWARLTQAPTASPYRALLFPLRAEGKSLAATAPNSLDLPLAFAWPDLEKGLCHPALGVRTTHPKLRLGVYAPSARNTLEANLAFPMGRPFPDRLALPVTSERGAARLLSLGQAQLVLGGAETASWAPPALFATYLSFTPARVGADFRTLFEASVDRADLIRFFVRAPSVAMYQLLPPALMPQQASVRPTASPQAPLEASLLYDPTLDDQRAVAERIQVKLHDRGLKIALKPLSRAELRERWASGDFELMLQALLLPPTSAAAFSIVLEAAGRHDLLSSELPPIGALSDSSARDARVQERAQMLKPTLSVIPLYAQAVRIQSSPGIAGLTLDAQGLPVLDQVFLSE